MDMFPTGWWIIPVLGIGAVCFVFFTLGAWVF